MFRRLRTRDFCFSELSFMMFSSRIQILLLLLPILVQSGTVIYTIPSTAPSTATALDPAPLGISWVHRKSEQREDVNASLDSSSSLSPHISWTSRARTSVWRTSKSWQEHGLRFELAGLHSKFLNWGAWGMNWNRTEIELHMMPPLRHMSHIL